MSLMSPNGGRSATILLGATTVVLLGVSVVQMYVLVPAYRRLLEGIGAVPSVPARAAIGVSHFGLLILVLLVANVGVGSVRELRGRTGAFAVALAVTALLLTIYLCLASAVYLDWAKIAARLAAS